MMNRREFTTSAAMAVLGGAAISIGCGGGGSSSPSAATPPQPDIVATVESNHGHAGTITSAQLLAGNAVDLDIQGTSGHTHKVSLSAAEVASIRAGVRVQKQSSGSPHTHTVTFN
jgi:hypothetical protein